MLMVVVLSLARSECDGPTVHNHDHHPCHRRSPHHHLYHHHYYHRYHHRHHHDNIDDINDDDDGYKNIAFAKFSRFPGVTNSTIPYILLNKPFALRT